MAYKIWYNDRPWYIEPEIEHISIVQNEICTMPQLDRKWGHDQPKQTTIHYVIINQLYNPQVGVGHFWQMPVGVWLDQYGPNCSSIKEIYVPNDDRLFPGPESDNPWLSLFI